MRQFFILLGIFACSVALADHDGSEGHDYNGRTFYCDDFRDTKEFAETEKEEVGRAYLIFAFCELHRGHLVPGIFTLKKAASLGDSIAAMDLAEYHSSGGYKLPRGQVTWNEADLKEAIRYRELALRLIESRPNYPFDDPYGDDFRNEVEVQPYLETAGNLTGSYVSLFTAKSIAHIESMNQDAGNATLELLYKAIEAADNCLAIPYRSDIWNERAYNNHMAICRTDKEFAKILLPLERERLRVSKASCRNIKLSECAAHNEVDSQIEALYDEYLEKANQLVAAL